MIAKRTQYTATLLKELAAIGQAPDDELDRTALRHLFAKQTGNATPDSYEAVQEGMVADLGQLNPEQRRAVSSLLINDVTVVTGPPGTGKSQVVSAALANARLKGQSVLFTSRNHKAIDAVVGRLITSSGEPLVIRCNSKEDPSLKFAFEHAIRDMLAVPRDDIASERFAKIREELVSLLLARGNKDRLAQKVTMTGEELGLLEDRMMLLSRNILPGLRDALAEKPELLSAEAMERVASTVNALLLGNSGDSSWARVRELVKCLALVPRYLRVRNRLQRVSDAPKLPTLPWPSVLKSLAETVPLFECGALYIRTRIECIAIEARLKELPALEGLVYELAGLTERIAELSPNAVSLDLDSRRGLPPECSRQEFDGLQAAISAMRTGLQGGNISAKTMALLHERAPVVLEGYPCWAVKIGRASCRERV